MLYTCHHRIDLFEPRPEDILLEDIAHHLAMRQRWNGAAMCHYSVADHALACSCHAETEHRDQPEIALWALLHDAAEAYLPDVPRPCRRGLMWMTEASGCIGFDDVEDAILCAVRDKFGLPWPIPAEVWEIDNRMLATEAYQLLPHRELVLESKAEPYPGAFAMNPDWEESRDEFLDRFADLT